MNIFANCISNKYVTIDDRDPLWMNKTKNKIKLKKRSPQVKQLQIQKWSLEISDIPSVKDCECDSWSRYQEEGSQYQIIGINQRRTKQLAKRTSIRPV